MFQLPSMSGLAVLEHCRASMTLPLDDSPAGERAQFGTDFHGEMEGWINANLQYFTMADFMFLTDAGRARSEDPEFVEVCKLGRKWVLQNFKHSWEPEKALAWNWRTDEGRVLPSEYHRDYRAKTEDEIPGTADIFSIEEDDKGAFVAIDDFKTGRSGPEHYKLQMVGLALAGSRMTMTGINRVRTRLIYVRAGKEVWPVEQWFDAMELDSWADQLKTWIEEGKLDPQAHPGAWCKALYCKARFSCPASGMAMVKADSNVSLPMLASDIHSMQQASQIHTQLKSIKEMHDRAYEALKEYVGYVGEVPLGNGESLTMGEESRTTIDGKAALAMLSGLGVDPQLLGGLQKRSTFQKLKTRKTGQ